MWRKVSLPLHMEGSGPIIYSLLAFLFATTPNFWSFHFIRVIYKSDTWGIRPSTSHILLCDLSFFSYQGQRKKEREFLKWEESTGILQI